MVTCCRVTGAVAAWSRRRYRRSSVPLPASSGWPLFDMKRKGTQLGEGRTELVVEEPERETGGLGPQTFVSAGRCHHRLRHRDGAGDKDRASSFIVA